MTDQERDRGQGLSEQPAQSVSDNSEQADVASDNVDRERDSPVVIETATALRISRVDISTRNGLVRDDNNGTGQVFANIENKNNARMHCGNVYTRNYFNYPPQDAGATASTLVVAPRSDVVFSTQGGLLTSLVLRVTEELLKYILSVLVFESLLIRRFRDVRGFQRIVGGKYRLHDSHRRWPIDPCEGVDFEQLFGAGAQVRMSIYFAHDEVIQDACPRCATKQAVMGEGQTVCNACEFAYFREEPEDPFTTLRMRFAWMPARRRLFRRAQRTFRPSSEDLDRPEHFKRISIGNPEERSPSRSAYNTRRKLPSLEDSMVTEWFESSDEHSESDVSSAEEASESGKVGEGDKFPPESEDSDRDFWRVASDKCFRARRR